MAQLSILSTLSNVHSLRQMALGARLVEVLADALELVPQVADELVLR